MIFPSNKVYWHILLQADGLRRARENSSYQVTVPVLQLEQFFKFWATPTMLRGFPWLYAQELLVFWGPYRMPGIKGRSTKLEAAKDL